MFVLDKYFFIDHFVNIRKIGRWNGIVCPTDPGRPKNPILGFKGLSGVMWKRCGIRAAGIGAMLHGWR